MIYSHPTPHHHVFAWSVANTQGLSRALFISLLKNDVFFLFFFLPTFWSCIGIQEQNKKLQDPNSTLARYNEEHRH